MTKQDNINTRQDDTRQENTHRITITSTKTRTRTRTRG